MRFHVFALKEVPRDAPTTIRVHLCPCLPDTFEEMGLCEASEWGLTAEVCVCGGAMAERAASPWLCRGAHVVCLARALCGCGAGGPLAGGRRHRRGRQQISREAVVDKAIQHTIAD